MEYLECQPAYGKDYNSKKEVLAAWKDGKDWQIVEIGQHYGQYVNKESIQGKRITLNLRYKQLQQVCVVKGS